MRDFLLLGALCVPAATDKVLPKVLRYTSAQCTVTPSDIGLLV